MSVRSSSPTAAAGSYTIPTLEVTACAAVAFLINVVMQVICCDDGTQIVEFCNRMIRIYTGLEAEASKCRMILTITLLQLELGDVVGVSVSRC